MAYYIGIDGGGSKTHGIIENHNKEVVESTVGPTNYHSIGLAEAEKNIQVLLSNLITGAHIGLDDIYSICIGGAGVDCPDDVKRMTAIVRKTGFKGRLKVVNDCEIALVGANRGYNGGMLISGTGSTAMGINEENELKRVGGWGHLFDDVGSGYSIGRDAITAVFRSHDGRAESTELTKHILNFFEVETVESLVPKVYSKNLDKSKIAQVAEIVLKHSEDKHCQRIISSNVYELVNIVKALSHVINKTQFNLSISGSILLKSEIFNKLFKLELENALPHVTVKESDMTPVEGALLIARGL